MPRLWTQEAAADREGQMRAIARQIKQRLTDNPTLRPSDFAVTFRRVSPHLSLARQVFAEYNLPPRPRRQASASAVDPWEPGSDGCCTFPRTAGASETSIGALSSGFVDLERWKLSREDVTRFARWGPEEPPLGGTGSLGTRLGRTEGGGRKERYT